MPQKKNIWERLFSGDTEQTESSLTEAKSIKDTLHDEYGLCVLTDNVTVQELIEHNYHKVEGNELSRLNQIFQYIPQIVANSATRNAVDVAFKAATEGTYRVRLGAGMHLCRSHFTPGAYRAVGLSDINNKITGNAELFANDAVLSVSNAPQLALGIFNIVSMVTGQYFMSQVNSKLAMLTSGVGKLEKMMDAQRHGELRTVAQELEDIIAKSAFIITDTDKTNEAINELHGIQRIAGKSMNTAHELIENELKSFDERDKFDGIKVHIENVVKYLIEYRYATQIYSVATLLEVYMRNITDPDELTAFREQIDKRVKQYKADHETAESAIAEYLDKIPALNKRNAAQWIVSGLAAFVSEAATSLFGASSGIGGDVFIAVDDHFNNQRKKEKAGIYNQTCSEFDLLKDTELLDSPVSTIDLFIKTVGQEIEYVKIGNDYYTNIPEA